MTSMNSSANENAMSISICNMNNNNYVAESEFRAALSGIENRFSQIQNEGFKGRDGSAIRMTDTGPENHATTILLEAANESIAKHLTRIVRPLENEEYNAMSRIHQDGNDDDDDPVEDEDDINEFTNDDADFSTINNNDGQQELDFGPEDLIDEDAVVRVTKLRAEVRLASQQLAQYRDSVTLKALRLADEQIRLVSIVEPQRHQDDNDDPEEEQDRETKQTVERLREEFAMAATSSNSNHEMTQLLTDRLHQLTENLNSLDLESPAELLQETLDTVEMVQQEPLSQTERAIRSRNNEGMQFSHKVIEDPVERLNHFLG